MGRRLFISFFITVVALGVTAALIWWVALPLISGLPLLGGFGANRNVVSFHEQFQLDPDIPVIIFGPNHITGHSAPIVEETLMEPRVFIPASLVQERIDPFVFWDEHAEVFFISTHFALLEFMPGSSTFAANGMSLPLTTPIRRIGEEIFLPVDLLHNIYPWIIDFNEEQNIVVITDATVRHLPAVVVQDNASVRFWGNDRAPVAAFLSDGDHVFVFAEEESMNPEEFVRVRTMEGIPGYISLYEILRGNEGFPDPDREPLLHDFIDNRVAAPHNWPRGVRVNMVWEQAYNQQANTNNMERELHPSISVISPTWFEIDESGTHLVSRVSRSYVTWAQSYDVQVWPKVFDVSNDRARRMLMNRDNRRHVINQLVHYVDTLGFDGININFENLLNSSDGRYKIQFLRELAIVLRERGVVISAALKPPYSFNMIYQPHLVGLTVDFVQVMAYNQHYSGSANAGPNASLPWVQWTVETMLEEVPNYRLILGLPFWVNLWRENVITGELRKWQVPMHNVRAYFRENGGSEWEWLENYGLYYGEVAIIDEGETWIIRIWLECDRSIRAKMQLFAYHQLAGIAGWSRGLELPAVWYVLERFFM